VDSLPSEAVTIFIQYLHIISQIQFQFQGTFIENSMELFP